MLDLKVHPAADLETAAAIEYINADDPREAAAFVAALDSALTTARTDPERYRQFDGEFRKVRLGKFTYAAVYRMRGEDLQVLAVMHLHQRPGYWKRRAKNWE